MKRTSLYLCLVAAAIMLLTSCTRTQIDQAPEPRLAVKPVTIHIVQNEIRVDPRVQDLRRSWNQQVRWQAPGSDIIFTVTFKEDTPFQESIFDNDPATPYTDTSGPIIVAPSPDGSDQFFPYGVEVEGYGSIDPGVIIW